MAEDIENLEKKIEEAKTVKPAQADDSREMADRSTGMRAGSEFMAYIFSGGFVGWLLGTWLGNMPLWLILMMFLGFGMGVWRAYQTMK